MSDIDNADQLDYDDDNEHAETDDSSDSSDEYDDIEDEMIAQQAHVDSSNDSSSDSSSPPHSPSKRPNLSSIGNSPRKIRKNKDLKDVVVGELYNELEEYVYDDSTASAIINFYCYNAAEHTVDILTSMITDPIVNCDVMEAEVLLRSSEMNERLQDIIDKGQDPGGPVGIICSVDPLISPFNMKQVPTNKEEGWLYRWVIYCPECDHATPYERVGAFNSPTRCPRIECQEHVESNNSALLQVFQGPNNTSNVLFEWKGVMVSDETANERLNEEEVIEDFKAAFIEGEKFLAETKDIRVERTDMSYICTISTLADHNEKLSSEIMLRMQEISDRLNNARTTLEDHPNNEVALNQVNNLYEEYLTVEAELNKVLDTESSPEKPVRHFILLRENDTYYMVKVPAGNIFIADDLKSLRDEYKPITIDELYLLLCSHNDTFRRCTIGRIEVSGELSHRFYKNLLIDRLTIRRLNKNTVPMQKRILATMFNNPQFADVLFTFEDSSIKLPAYRAVLASVSEYFKALLFPRGENNYFKENMMQEIELKEIRYSSMSEIVRFLYTDEIIVENIVDMNNLRTTVDMFNIPELTAMLNVPMSGF